MKICEVDGCFKESKARGLCSAHYSQLRRTGNPLGSLKNPDSIIENGFIPQQPIFGCQVDKCENPHFCKGYCSFHYQRWTDHGDPNPTHIIKAEKIRSSQLCSKCQINTRRSDGHSWCQPCLNESSKNYRIEKGNRFIRYGLSKDDLRGMWLLQGGRCDICKDRIVIETCHVDHDNSCCSKEITKARRCCGKCIRALLCGSCNQGLGNFKDDCYRLQEACNYLVRSS